MIRPATALLTGLVLITTTAGAQAQPADKFGWSPGPGVMTVAKVYAHVARYNYLYPATSLGVPAPGGRDADAAENLADQAALVARLRESRDHVRQAVKSLLGARHSALGTRGPATAVAQFSGWAGTSSGR